MGQRPMHLHVVTPGSVVVDASADKVSTEAMTDRSRSSHATSTWSPRSCQGC
jgi:hypothetical protein